MKAVEDRSCDSRTRNELGAAQSDARKTRPEHVREETPLNSGKSLDVSPSRQCKHGDTSLRKDSFRPSEK